jgi:hypothetical protein
MPDFLTISDLSPVDAASLADMQSLAAESMGWQPLGEGAYLHHGAKDNPQAEAEAVIHVVGIPDTALAGLDVLLLT